MSAGVDTAYFGFQYWCMQLSLLNHRFTVAARAAVITFVCGVLVACSWQDPVPVDQRPDAGQYGDSHIPADAADLDARLYQFFSAWEGVPYRFGGQGRDGIDCSALVQRTAKATMGLDLPRTTSQQMRVGQRIDPQAVQIGDLVFFETGRAVNHVGVYLGHQKFFHASQSRGVAISRLDESYWRSRMLQIRRLPHQLQ